MVEKVGRIDLHTGALSLCSSKDGVWNCVRLKEESTGPDSDLAMRIENLEKRLAQLEERNGELPDVRELEQMMDMSETMMKRFFGMVQDLKQDMAE